MIDVPDELKFIPQWVVWRMLVRHGKKTKVLFDPITGRAASTTDPSTWRTFAEAELAKFVGGYDGIGYVFSKPHNIIDGKTGEFIRRIEIEDPYCGIDLDDSLDENKAPLPWAAPIIARFNTRAEISPSGRGVKMFIRGKLPRVNEGKCRCRKGNIELYDRARFFTVTGTLLAGTPTGIAERQAELLAFFNETFPPPPPMPPRMRPTGTTANFSDNEIIRRAGTASNGMKFRRLFYDGAVAGHASGSEADLALCSMIAFWAGPDPDRIDRIFRATRIVR